MRSGDASRWSRSVPAGAAAGAQGGVEGLDRFVRVEPAAAAGRTSAAGVRVAADFPRRAATQVRDRAAVDCCAARRLGVVELARRAGVARVRSRVGSAASSIGGRGAPRARRRCRTPTARLRSAAVDRADRSTACVSARPRPGRLARRSRRRRMPRLQQRRQPGDQPERVRRRC